MKSTIAFDRVGLLAFSRLKHPATRLKPEYKDGRVVNPVLPHVQNGNRN